MPPLYTSHFDLLTEINLMRYHLRMFSIHYLQNTKSKITKQLHRVLMNEQLQMKVLPQLHVNIESQYKYK